MPCSDLMLTRRDDLTCCQICGVILEKDLAFWLDEDYPLCEKCWDSIRDDVPGKKGEGADESN